MNPKELKIQDALGLLKIYKGYIRVGEEDLQTVMEGDYIVYSVKAPTRKSARHRLKSIVKKLTAQAGIPHKLEWFIEATDNSVYPDVNIIETRETTI